jgi:prepilin-type N-terminal cleavage/methylation domain-containing protein
MMSDAMRTCRRRSNFAFTLVEVLVVISILALILATLLPMVQRARVSAKRARLALDLNAVSIALDAYHDDFGDYPRPSDYDYSNNTRGAAILCRALLGPQDANGPYADGADGFGFRTRRVNGVAQGRVWGPYLRPESFKLYLQAGRVPLIADIDGQPILYYVARANQPNIHLPDGFVALSLGPPTTQPDDYPVPPSPTVSPLFNVFDNSGPYPDGLYRMRLMLGDVSLNGAIDADETPASTGPYLVWSAGPDGAYGPVPDPRALTAAERRTLRSHVDDVTNFQFR